jgi:hypothetical protein
VFSHSEAWFARYVPQMWALPLVAAMIGLGSPRKPVRVATGVLLALAFYNAVGISHQYLSKQIRMSQEFAAGIASASRPGNPLLLELQYPFDRGFLETLNEEGVQTELVMQGRCIDPIPMPFRIGNICRTRE